MKRTDTDALKPKGVGQAVEVSLYIAKKKILNMQIDT